MERSDKFRARQQRIRKFGLSVHVREDSLAMRSVYDAISRRKLNDKQKKIMNNYWKRANAIAAVQRSGGSGLYVDRYLRHFTQEYNGRIFGGQGIHMPTSFNTINAFLDLDEKVMVLKLLPQQENVITFGRLLDHITDPKMDTSVVSAISLMDELTIYEINMLGGHAEFKIPGAEEFVFCGSAFCLGSGLVDHSQKSTVAARAMAEKKTVGQRS